MAPLACSAVGDYLEKNRDLWNTWTKVHVTSDFYDVEGFKQGESRLRPWIVQEVGDVRGKSLLHLQCHFGLDTLSWARLGAEVTGVDFSDEAITRARALADELGINATFVHSNVLELIGRLDERFDVVFTSFGVLGWLPDLTRWADVVAYHLKPGAFFYIAEFHPILHVFDEEATELRARYPYFSRAEPLAFPTRGSYAYRDTTEETLMEYTWPHGLGEIVSALAAVGLRIEFLHEFNFVHEGGLWAFLKQRDDGTWGLPPGSDGEIPLLFSLRATKPAVGAIPAAVDPE